MAYSPSPRTASLSIAGPSRFNRRSPSPPFQQYISKREKKRFNMEDRLAQISNDFSRDRDLIYRKQLHAFQLDIDYIRHAELYTEKVLEEYDEGCTEDTTPSAAASTSGRVVAHAQPNGNAVSGRIGVNASRFAQKINDAIEQRDADLATVAYRHNFRIDEFQKDYEFNVAVAHLEHQQLLETLRRRLIVNLNQKKASMQKEKEKLDIADTHAALLHPNHFSLNTAASPGGPQSNRKTRNTRHRLEVDDMDTINGSNKRKRKAPGDNDNGSPGPTGRDAEPTNIFREANAKLEYHQVSAPLYTLDRLFSQRDLDNNLQLATFGVIEDFKRRKLTKGSHTSLTSFVGTNADVSDVEDNADAEPDLGMDGVVDDVFLAAPDMERTATNASQHATRSSRIVAPSKHIAAGDTLGCLAGRAAAARLIGTVGAKEKRREDEYQRAPPLSDQETEDDLAMLKAAIEEEDAGKLANEDLLEEVAGHREDHVGTGSVDGEETAEETEG